MTDQRLVTLTLSAHDANNLLLHLNAASVFYAAKADRQNASPRVKRINLNSLNQTRDLWLQVYNARKAAGVCFVNSTYGSK